MTDEFSTCPSCGQGVLVSQTIVDSECIENHYSCGHKLDRIHVSVQIGLKAELKTKSRNGAFIGKKKREYEIEDRYRIDIDSGKVANEKIFLHHKEKTSAFHMVVLEKSNELKHIDCKKCGNNWKSNFNLPVENYFLIEHDPEVGYLHSYKIQCLKVSSSNSRVNFPTLNTLRNLSKRMKKSLSNFQGGITTISYGNCTGFTIKPTHQ